ncbi:hypothetical protein BD779DRAFT_1805772 [Infundibulicybe gibba]|nr:hypothetical protein BD779DRAFT_1805772 [Infundibulicybe gibba]
MSEVIQAGASDSYRPRKRSRIGRPTWQPCGRDLDVQPCSDSSGTKSAEYDDEINVIRTIERGRLDLFLSMPLDVVFEILGFLHPRDLIAFTRTNKMFRQTVHPRGSIWKRSRIVNRIPDCYPGVSEARWAFILFGGNRCHNCGVRNVRKFDFGLCRRVCAICNRRNVIDATEFKDMFPQVDELVLSLIPQTNPGPSPYFDLTSLKLTRPVSYTKSSKKGFWKEDIQRVVEEWRMHQQSIQLGAGAAEEEYTLYLGQRMRDVEHITQHAGVCIKWAIGCVHERNRELNETKWKRCQDIREGLIALGFECRDTYFAMRLPIAKIPTPLTPAAWAQIQSQLVPLVEVQRDARITRETANIQRIQVSCTAEGVRGIKTADFRRYEPHARKSYAAYLFRLLPLEFWAPAHLPTVDDLIELDPFKSIIESDSSVVVDSSSFTAAIEDLRLPELIVEWQNSTNHDVDQAHVYLQPEVNLSI